MKVTIDTKEDSHEDIRKVIKMLQHVVGDDIVQSDPIFTNQPSSLDAAQNSGEAAAPFENIFGPAQPEQQAEAAAEPVSAPAEPVSSGSSTDDLFAELFSHDELQKMGPVKEEDIEEELQHKSIKGETYKIEFY